MDLANATVRIVSVVEDVTSALADRCAIQRELGRGGMATVYLAGDLKHHRQVVARREHDAGPSGCFSSVLCRG